MQIKNLSGKVIFETEKNNIIGEDLSGKILIEADFKGIPLIGVNFKKANLEGSDFSGLNINTVDFKGANLKGCNFEDCILPYYKICPSEGSFIAYKRVNHPVKKTGGPLIAKIRIPEDAKRTSNLVGRKCRADKVETLKIFYAYNLRKELVANSTGNHLYTSKKYEVGEITYSDTFNDDIRVECTNGIHFFVSLEEAINYQ